MMARIAATRSVIVVVVSSLFVLSLARRTIDQLPSDAEGSASSLQALDPLLLLTRGESDPSVADQDPEDKRADLEAAKPLPAAAEDDDPTALAVADRGLRRSSLSCLVGGCGNEETEAPRRGGGDAAALPAAEEEEEAERVVAGAEANRRSAEVMGWIPKEGDGAKEKEGEKAKKKKRGKKPRDSDSDSDSGSDSDSDSDSDDDDEEEEDEVEGKGKMKKKEKKKEKGGFLKWFWRALNRFF